MNKRFVFFIIFIFFIFLILHFLGWYKFYQATIWYDKLLHFLAGISVFLTAWYLIDRVTKIKNIILKFFIAFLILLIIAVLWEVFEFTIDTCFKPSPPLQPGVEDTLWDLIFDMLGGIVGIGLTSFFKKIMIR